MASFSLSMGPDTGSSLTLESLPSEVVCLILGHMPDLESLFSLLKASPRAFQEYRNAKGIILSHMVHNQIPDSVRPLVQLVQRPPTEDMTDMDVRQLRLLLGNVRDGICMYPQLLINHPTQSRKLLHLHQTVTQLALEFAQHRLSLLAKALDATHDQNCSPGWATTPLSATERDRLIRALYHMELYGRISCRWRGEEEQDEWDTIYTLVPEFVSYLQPWELEEFGCVEQYLVERLTTYLNQVEDEMMDEFIEEAILEPRGYSGRWDAEDAVFTDDYPMITRDQWLRSSLARGLTDIQMRLTAATEVERWNVLGDTEMFHLGLGKYLPKEYVADIGSRGLDGLNCADYCEDTMSLPNAAWFWAVRGIGKGASTSYNPKIGISPLYWCVNRSGYVFWNRKRLEDMGLLKKKLSTPLYEVLETSNRVRLNELSIENRFRTQSDKWRKQGLKLRTRTENFKGVPDNYLYVHLLDEEFEAAFDEEGKFDFDKAREMRPDLQRCWPVGD